MLCCLVFNICECGFQRSKVVLVLVNDLQNHITLRIIGHADALKKWSPGWTGNFQELKICGHGTVLDLYCRSQDRFRVIVSELLRHKKQVEVVLLM